MGTYNLQSYRSVLRSKLKEIEKSSDRSTLQASKYMLLQAKRLAPRSTGETIKGIRRYKTRKGQWRVESKVSGRFKQNMFANQTAPFRTINYTEKSIQPFYAIPQKVVYGTGAITPSGNQINWTGTPRFFHIATLRTAARFKKMARLNTQKALRVSI